MTGLEAPIIRAALMSGLVLGAGIMGYRTWTGWILVVTVLIMLVLNPAYIRSVSFQLSVAATIGVVYLVETVEKLYIVKRLPGIIRPAFATTLAAQMMVAPILLAKFGEFSLSAPLSNTIALGAVDAIMIGGGVLSIVSLVLPLDWLPAVFGLISVPLKVVILPAQFFSKLEAFNLILPEHAIWLYSPWYLALWLLYRRYL